MSKKEIKARSNFSSFYFFFFTSFADGLNSKNHKKQLLFKLNVKRKLVFIYIETKKICEVLKEP
ncbi:hypothetical protein R7X46_03260 [Mesomycoplasma ovipneumoniae]|nr:hypothetical protein [Mesomycoplasma ovipneumoniae]